MGMHQAITCWFTMHWMWQRWRRYCWNSARNCYAAWPPPWVCRRKQPNADAVFCSVYTIWASLPKPSKQLREDLRIALWPNKHIRKHNYSISVRSHSCSSLKMSPILASVSSAS